MSLSCSKVVRPLCFDVVIVGGGIIGLMTAIELADAGVKVAILDQQALGREASWAGGGILAPLYPWLLPLSLHQLYQHSLQLYPQWVRRLIEETKIDPEYYACGMTVLQHGDAAVKLREWLHTTQLPYQWQGEKVYWPHVANICNPQLLKGLRQLISQHALLNVYERSQVLDMVPGRVLTADKVFHCDHIVIAAGAWSGVLAQRCGLNLDVFPVKGQMLLYERPDPPLLQIRMIDDHYLIPRKNGCVLAGSTLELESGFDQLPDVLAHNKLKKAAEQIHLPLVSAKIFAQWSGLRPGSSNTLPLIGPYPGQENLWVNTGHFRNGLCLAPGSARLLVQQMLGQSPAVISKDMIEVAPFMPTALMI